MPAYMILIREKLRDAEAMTPTDYRARAAAARLGDSEIG